MPTCGPPRGAIGESFRRAVRYRGSPTHRSTYRRAAGSSDATPCSTGLLASDRGGPSERAAAAAAERRAVAPRRRGGDAVATPRQRRGGRPRLTSSGLFSTRRPISAREPSESSRGGDGAATARRRGLPGPLEKTENYAREPSEYRRGERGGDAFGGDAAAPTAAGSSRERRPRTGQQGGRGLHDRDAAPRPQVGHGQPRTAERTLSSRCPLVLALSRA